MRSKGNKLCLRGGEKRLGNRYSNHLDPRWLPPCNPGSCQVLVLFFEALLYAPRKPVLSGLVWLGFGSLQPNWNTILPDIGDIKRTKAWECAEPDMPFTVSTVGV